MNPRIYLLALAAFVASIDENLVGGILPLLSRELGVALGAALGGVVIAKDRLEMTPLMGALMTALALAAACLSLMAAARRKL
ncbi:MULTISPECIES: hypothetical protein [unclassified Pseudomonas]|uniref:hypothetical protein n=1 Tax=unclassified Pseudomonas TaxID=196821 RepID=UPI0011EC2640|nr:MULTISPECIES: hypothetical protein [unclassified Pseudomonas]KAA0950230.1 hypothetical protein FQ182_00415 [Pseudomonas sp. ANT_H4]KAA0951372.1 hypothetical protein FQ186_16460 [Pseudomonas sp. ANT_H14]